MSSAFVIPHPQMSFGIQRPVAFTRKGLSVIDKELLSVLDSKAPLTFLPDNFSPVPVVPTIRVLEHLALVQPPYPVIVDPVPLDQTSVSIVPRSSFTNENVTILERWMFSLTEPGNENPRLCYFLSRVGENQGGGVCGLVEVISPIKIPCSPNDLYWTGKSLVFEDSTPGKASPTAVEELEAELGEEIEKVHLDDGGISENTFMTIEQTDEKEEFLKWALEHMEGNGGEIDMDVIMKEPLI